AFGGSEVGARSLLRSVLRPFWTRDHRINLAGKGRNMNPVITLKTTPSLLITLAFLCFGILPTAQAVVPAPDGGYPGQNTAEGQSALLHLAAGGTYNTALGWASLAFNVTGDFNTAVGAATLLNNIADENTATGAGALL